MNPFARDVLPTLVDCTRTVPGMLAIEESAFPVVTVTAVVVWEMMVAATLLRVTVEISVPLPRSAPLIVTVLPPVTRPTNGVTDVIDPADNSESH